MKAFVEMRHYVQQNDNLLFRINYLEEKQQFTDARVNQLFAALDKQKLPPAQGIFSKGNYSMRMFSRMTSLKVLTNPSF